MASTPRFKVYDADNVYQAACKRPEEAGALMALLGPGSSIRDGHTKAAILWLEVRVLPSWRKLRRGIQYSMGTY